MRAFYNEIDDHSCGWLSNLMDAGLITPGKIDDRDIRLVRPEDLRGYERAHFFAGIGTWDYALNLAGWRGPVWTGSCPCQPFSNAGRRGAFGDERHLWPHWLGIIREQRPDVIFGEQVSSAHGLAWIDFVCADLEAEAYAVAALDTSAAGVGAPHIRNRLYFVADAMRHSSADCYLADHHGEGRQLERAARLHGDGQGRQDAAGCGEAMRVGHATKQDQPPCTLRSGEGGSACGGFWRNARPIFCKDGFVRFAEPGIFPMVDGAAFRVGSGSTLEGKARTKMLQAAGNAIVATQAAEFIAAFMECDEVR
jgi:DNA (cytosine-5)-methyltransferase 1